MKTPPTPPGADGGGVFAELAELQRRTLRVVDELGRSRSPGPSIHDTFSLNLRLARGKYVLFIGCER